MILDVGRESLNKFCLKNPMHIISQFPNRNILIIADKNDQVMAKMFISFLSCTLIVIKEYIERHRLNGLDIIEDIKSVLKGETNNGTDLVSKLFLEYVFKERKLPSIYKDKYYEDFFNYVTKDEFLSVFNDISVSIDGYIEDIPFL